VPTDDDHLWRAVLSDVLMRFTDELAATDKKCYVITSLSLHRAKDIAMAFDKFELWKDGLRNDIEKGGWSDMIEHRSCIRTVGWLDRS
jgi:hypothetical protein